ncbi:E3 ubiquitin-protein ligase BOI-like [Iris pallida]|uniref:E3 ubiquitin-protein ligase BOI-like n=1 Tax=Iris pallida TaxID=29817 RepID=A0AAX6ETY9_IRIPA|nr:E3 ubiquitin-protein ligase BOI-like [Iris pallida]
MAVTHFKRSAQEMMNFPGFGILDDQSTAIIFSNGGIDNPPNKRKKEASDVPISGTSFLQPSIISPMINLDQLHTQHPPTVCTGLQLAFAPPPPSISHNANRSNPIASSSSLLSNDFMTQINQYSAEVDQFLRAQAHQLRRTLVESQKKNYKSLLIAAEQSATRTIVEKDAELERATRLTMELENRLARLKAESATWQAKAVMEQSKAIALHAQLEQASAAAVAANELNYCGESPVKDTESVYVDADRPTTNAAAATLACRACGMREVSVLILPCRHVSVCEECSASGNVKACPVCNCAMNGSVQVYLS